jgi:hypothetical protein
MAKKAAAQPAKRSRSMSDEHKAALAEGREQGRAVRRYLEALESYRPKRGRKRTQESITKRLADIEARLDANPDPLSPAPPLPGEDGPSEPTVGQQRRD